MEKKMKLNGALKGYLRWPLFLTVILAAMTIVIFRVNVTSGLVALAGTLLYVLLAMLVFQRYRPQVMNDLMAFAQQYENLEREMLDGMEIPYALIDLKGKLIWSNEQFHELIGKEKVYGRSIDSALPEINADWLFSGKEIRDFEIYRGDRIFRASVKKLSMKDAVQQMATVTENPKDYSIWALYLYDETELREYIQKNEDEKFVAALAYLDNYDEALQTIEEVRRSLLIALIDRKIAKYFSNYDGLVRKLEKDKYFIVMKKESLDILKEQKFHILDEVKTVNIGNEMAVTLSIGIGLNGNGYLQNYEYSRVAIEMALARGGDQVVIKDADSITYFGGKAQQVEKNTRVKARVKAQALKEIMSSRERIVVMGHKITDVDALGAAIGLYRAGKTLGKPVHIVVNDPSTSIRPLMTGFIDSPDYEPSMFIDSAEAKDLVDMNTAVIVVDTNRPSYTECQDLLKKTRTVIVLDHHRRGNEIIQDAVLSYVEPYASSTCEMVSEILQYFYDGMKLRSLEADCLYAGILIDTNNFATRAGVRTFEAAAFLRRNGADITRVRKMLRDNIDSYKARAEAIRNAEIYRKYFAIAKCPSEGLESPTVVGAQAANELLNIDGVKASFVLTRYNDEVFISARAIDEVNVQVMMEKMGGGGHINIAGAQLQKSVDEVESMLKAIIDETIQESDWEGENL